jgi:hypothetical protein
LRPSRRHKLPELPRAQALERGPGGVLPEQKLALRAFERLLRARLQLRTKLPLAPRRWAPPPLVRRHELRTARGS